MAAARSPAIKRSTSAPPCKMSCLVYVDLAETRSGFMLTLLSNKPDAAFASASPSPTPVALVPTRGNCNVPMALLMTVVPNCSITDGARSASMAAGTVVGMKPVPEPVVALCSSASPKARRAMLGIAIWPANCKPWPRASFAASCAHSASAPSKLRPLLI